MIRLTKIFTYEERNGKYRFLLLRDVTVDVGIELGSHDFYDARGILRVRMRGSEWTVKAGYAWDGCSPKFKIFGMWVGTPDFGYSRLASLIHDTGYQFLDVPCFPLKRHECDEIFGCTINRDGNRYKAAFVYAGAVWMFGGIHRGLATVFTARKPCTCTCEELTV